jgi:hypothetical protein
MDKIYQDDLARILGVKVRTLKQWRVSDFKENGLYLPCHQDNKVTPSYYLLDEVEAWAQRNPQYRAKLRDNAIEDPVLRGRFVQEAIGNDNVVLPRALATQAMEALRGATPPQPQPTNWSNIHENA